jgi:hypothetical protein
MGGKIAYGVVAGVVSSLYIAIAAVKRTGRGLGRGKISWRRISREKGSSEASRVADGLRDIGR